LTGGFSPTSDELAAFRKPTWVLNFQLWSDHGLQPISGHCNNSIVWNDERCKDSPRA
jgi:hypothetical protein